IDADSRFFRGAPESIHYTGRARRARRSMPVSISMNSLVCSHTMAVNGESPNPRESDMLKKARAEASGDVKSSKGGKGIPQAVLDSSPQIWLAGLPASSKSQQVGKQVSDMRVMQGEQLEAKA